MLILSTFLLFIVLPIACTVAVLAMAVWSHDSPALHAGPVSRNIGVVDFDGIRKQKHHEKLIH